MSNKTYLLHPVSKLSSDDHWHFAVIQFLDTGSADGDGTKLMKINVENYCTDRGDHKYGGVRWIEAEAEGDFSELPEVTEAGIEQLKVDMKQAWDDSEAEYDAAGGADDAHAQCERCYESTEDFRPVIVECGGSESTVNTCSNCLTELYGPNWRELAAGADDDA
jgi:hypothetical protein